MHSRTSTFLQSIEAIHKELDSVWKNGRYPNTVKNSGCHWSLPGHRRPVSISVMEGYILYNIAYAMNAANVIEIGTAFGYSTLWIAGGLRSNRVANNWLASVDCLSEGTLGNTGILFAKKKVNEIGLDSIVHFHNDRSPESLPKITKDKKLCMAFIDGDHKNDQPSRDYLGISPLLRDSGIIIWHDVDESYDTPKAIKLAEKDGFYTVEFNTSCKMCASYREPKEELVLRDAFSASRCFRLLSDNQEYKR